MSSPTYYGLESSGIESRCVRSSLRSRQSHKLTQPPIQTVSSVLLWMKRSDLFLNTHLIPVPKKQWEGGINYRNLTVRQGHGARNFAYVVVFLGVVTICHSYKLTHSGQACKLDLVFPI